VNSAFIYKVQAVDIYSSASPDSNSDLAMTFTFLDDPIVPNVTPIKGAQIVQMRNAVNIVRGIAGIGDYPFSDGALGAVKVKLLHLTQLETALNEARTSLGLTAVSYPSRTIGSKVGAAEFTLLRNGMK